MTESEGRDFTADKPAETFSAAENIRALGDLAEQAAPLAAAAYGAYREHQKTKRAEIDARDSQPPASEPPSEP